MCMNVSFMLNKHSLKIATSCLLWMNKHQNQSVKIWKNEGQGESPISNSYKSFLSHTIQQPPSLSNNVRRVYLLVSGINKRYYCLYPHGERENLQYPNSSNTQSRSVSNSSTLTPSPTKLRPHLKNSPIHLPKNWRDVNAISQPPESPTDSKVQDLQSVINQPHIKTNPVLTLNTDRHHHLTPNLKSRKPEASPTSLQNIIQTCCVLHILTKIAYPSMC